MVNALEKHPVFFSLVFIEVITILVYKFSSFYWKLEILFLTTIIFLIYSIWHFVWPYAIPETPGSV